MVQISDYKFSVLQCKIKLMLSARNYEKTRQLCLMKFHSLFTFFSLIKDLHFYFFLFQRLSINYVRAARTHDVLLDKNDIL